jgi:hypothetical protein
MGLIIRAKLVKLTRKKINCIFAIYHTIGLYCISQHITTHRAKLLVNLVYFFPLYSFTWFCDCAKKWNGWCNHITTVLDPEATMHIDGTYHTIVVCPLTSFTSHIVFFSINYITDTQPAHHENGRNSVHRLSYPSRLEPPCCQQQLAAAGIFLG